MPSTNVESLPLLLPHANKYPAGGAGEVGRRKTTSTHTKTQNNKKQKEKGREKGRDRARKKKKSQRTQDS